MNAQSLKEMNAALKKLERQKKKHRCKEKMMYKNINKKYKKIDWKQNYLTKSDVDESLPNSALGVLRKMRNTKVVRCFNKEFYKTSNFENLFLL